MTEALRSRFDWYQATFDDLDDGRVPAFLASSLPGASLVRGKGRNGYATCMDVVADEQLLAHVYGHSSRAGEVHVQVSSGACDAVVPLLRRMWPYHRVSRVDSALDFFADFAALDLQAVAFAQRVGVKYRLVTDSDGGATRYLGAKSSEVMVRLYKKSEQLRAIHPEQAEAVPDGLVRAEIQVRPGKRDVKAAGAFMSPDDFWGCAEWSTQLATELLDLEPTRTATHYRRESSWARTLRWMGTQYAPAVGRQSQEVGRRAVALEVLAALGIDAADLVPAKGSDA